MAPPTQYSANWRVRCFASPGSDTDLALHVYFDNARFLIGCGEGTQRAFVQKKLGMKWLEAVLLPSADARTRAGLPGEWVWVWKGKRDGARGK